MDESCKKRQHPMSAGREATLGLVQATEENTSDRTTAMQETLIVKANTHCSKHIVS